MAKLTLDLSDITSVKEVVELQKEVPVEQPKFKQRSPVDWDIRPGTNTEIVASSNMGDKFSGTIAEFNRRLRA